MRNVELKIMNDDWKMVLADRMIFC